jgi:hypothetical protein
MMQDVNMKLNQDSHVKSGFNKKKNLFTSKLDSNLTKRLVNATIEA